MHSGTFVIIIAWGLSSLMGLIWNLRNLSLSLRSKYWNEVDCEIIESSVKIVQYRIKSYYPIISYRFKVNGLDYEGNRIKYGGTGGTESVANDYCEKYPLGRIVKVSFDPMNHKRSVLEPGPSWRIFAALVLWLVLGAICVTGAWEYLEANH